MRVTPALKEAREDFEIKDDPKRAAASSGASIVRLAEAGSYVAV
jgi:hypothetical protein